MSNDKGRYGPPLYAFLEAEWQALGTTRGAWCREVTEQRAKEGRGGLQASTVLRWSEGSDPELGTMRLIAEALGRPMLDILLAAEVLTPDEVGGQKVGPPRVPDVDEAIERDPRLTDEMRAALRANRALVTGDRGAVSKTRGKKR